MVELSALRKPKRWLAAVAVAAAVAGSTVAAAPANAATSGHWINVSFSNSLCANGGSVKSIQFGAVPGITSVPAQAGNNAWIAVPYGSRSIFFAGKVWCSQKYWWQGWWTTPFDVYRTVYVPGTATSVRLS